LRGGTVSLQAHPRPAPRHIVEDYDADHHWYGPKVVLGFYPAGLEDHGGCPYHTRPRNSDNTNWAGWLLDELFDACGCVTRFQITIEWWWGHRGWWACTELNAIARLHPRYVPAREYRPHQHGAKR
jgi:hypothetical protein